MCISYSYFCLQEACRKPQQVCGHNGETYNTVCDAFSDRVAVDYEGPCHAVGALSDLAPDSACSVIPCPPLASPGCQPVTPPGESTMEDNANPNLIGLSSSHVDMCCVSVRSCSIWRLNLKKDCNWRVKGRLPQFEVFTCSPEPMCAALFSLYLKNPWSGIIHSTII